VRFNHFLTAIVERNFNLIVGVKFGPALHVSYSLIKELLLDSVSHFIDRFKFCILHLGEVDTDFTTCCDTQALKIGPCVTQLLCVVEHCFGRHAALVNANSSRNISIVDNHGSEALLRGSDCGNVTASTGTDHSNIVFVPLHKGSLDAE